MSHRPSFEEALEASAFHALDDGNLAHRTAQNYVDGRQKFT
jgi:hypothetical protein